MARTRIAYVVGATNFCKLTSQLVDALTDDLTIPRATVGHMSNM